MKLSMESIGDEDHINYTDDGTNYNSIFFCQDDFVKLNLGTEGNANRSTKPYVHSVIPDAGQRYYFLSDINTLNNTLLNSNSYVVGVRVPNSNWYYSRCITFKDFSLSNRWYVGYPGNTGVQTVGEGEIKYYFYIIHKDESSQSHPNNHKWYLSADSRGNSVITANDLRLYYFDSSSKAYTPDPVISIDFCRQRYGIEAYLLARISCINLS